MNLLFTMSLSFSPQSQGAAGRVDDEACEGRRAEAGPRAPHAVPAQQTARGATQPTGADQPRETGLGQGEGEGAVPARTRAGYAGGDQNTHRERTGT